MLHVLKTILSMAALAIMGLAVAVPAYADPITLFNTGATAEGSVDPHYTLIQSADPAFPGPNAFVVSTTGYPLPGPWTPNNATSKWIAPQANQSGGGAAGVYIFRTTFDLTGLNPSTAVITGQWTTDNNGVDILINGVSAGFTTPFEAFSQGFFPFMINSGFVAGVNTLDFVVNNGGLPIGLRVEMSGVASPIDGACVSPPPDLVSWWPGDGNANDIRDNNNGALQNGATFAPGLVGQAFSLDGIDDVALVPDSPNLNFNSASPITVDLWAFRTGTSPVMHLVGKRSGCDGGLFNYQMALNTLSGQGLQFGSGFGPGNEVATGIDLPLNTWTHLAGTFDGSAFRFYINGQLVATSAGMLGPTTTAPLVIGGAGTCSTFAGLIDEVEIHNRALSSSEIQAVYNAGSAGKCKTATGADLAITKTVAPDPALTGSNISYTITVANNGPGAASNVVVTDNLPASTTFVSCSATGGGVCGGSGNNRTVTFTSLAAGESATITLVANVICSTANGATISNTASVNSSTPDPIADNNSATAIVTASNPPPVITNVSANPSVLWPPNHKMVDVTVNYSVMDNCGSPSCVLSVSSNEPINGTGDGDAAPDWEIVDAHRVRLRAERSGNGTGRIYTITITCRDSAVASSSRSVTAHVPKSQGQN